MIAISAYDWQTLFGGYHWDAETGLFLAGYRELVSDVGTWGSRDPLHQDATSIVSLLDNAIALIGGIESEPLSASMSALTQLRWQIDGANSYEYCGRNPIRHTDSFGLQYGDPGAIPLPPGLAIDPAILAGLYATLAGLRAALLANIWNIAIAAAIAAAIACLINAIRTCVPAYNRCAAAAYRTAALKSAGLCPRGYKGDFKEQREINHAKCIARIYMRHTKPLCDSSLRWCIARCGVGGFRWPKFAGIAVPAKTCADLCDPGPLVQFPAGHGETNRCA